MTRDSDVERLLYLREIFESLACPMSKNPVVGQFEFGNLPSRQHHLRDNSLAQQRRRARLVRNGRQHRLYQKEGCVFPLR